MAPRSKEVNVSADPRAASTSKSSTEAIIVGGKPLRYTRSDVREHIAKFTNRSGKQDLEGLWYILSTVALWVGLYAAPLWVLPLHALITVRLFVVGVHDTAHGSTFSKRWMNDVVGTFIGPMTCSPYRYWQRGHDFHHEHSNDLDFQQFSQSAPLTVAEFKRWSPLWQGVYRVLNIPIVMIAGVAPFAMAVLSPLSATTAPDWSLQLGLFGLMWYLGQLGRMFATMAVAACLGVFMFHLQHTYEECVREQGRNYFENGYFGSSLLLVPSWLRYFTAGIEVHHIHHLNAKVPWFNLYACHESAPAGMWEGVRAISFNEGWRTLRLVLYSEEKNRLLTFAEMDADDAKAQGKAQGKAL